MFKRLISSLVCFTFIFSNLPFAHAQDFNINQLPVPGSMVSVSSAFVPLMITGLSVHPENPLLMDFIVSTGNSGLNAAQVKEQSNRLIKYFLACLTIPENDQWVNLSPYEKQRIVPEDLGQTVLGRDMLAQDYLLKQLTASLIYPEKSLGKNFWDKVYSKANEMYGTTQVPVNTFNKVWILPDTAKVYEHKDTVFVVKSHLKVMLDEDYLALTRHSERSEESKGVNNLGSKIIRQIILPAIEQEINTGKNFAQMRQIYNSMILAVWFKKNLKQALLNQVYTDKAKVNGVNVDDPAIKEKIYKQYLQAYKKGVFNYIKEEVDQITKETIPRKYFSGGLTAVSQAMLSQATPEEAMAADRAMPSENENYRVDGLGVGISADRATVATQSAFHEKLWTTINEFSSTHGGATPQATHDVIRKVRVSDIVNAGGDIKNMPQAERQENMIVAEQKIEELSREGKKIAVGAMVAGMASRNQRGLLPRLYITAMQEDPEQFVDQTKLTAEEKEKIAQLSEGEKDGLKIYINSLNPFDASGQVTANADHDVLNRLLHESKALLPVNKEAIKADEYPDMPEKYRSKTGWYNFLAYTAINVARANDALQEKGLNRIFVYKIMASELNYQKIMDNLIQNDFFGLNVPGVIKDSTGKIIDIDHTDLRNEVIVYTQGMGYRLVAPVEVVEAQWVNDQKLLDQADKLTNAAEKQALWAKTQFATDGDRVKAEVNYNEALAFSRESESTGENVLYDSPVAEGHGERWAMQFQTNKFGPQIPNFLLDYRRKIQYDFFHNIDNMANLDDNWMVIFGWMLRNNKKLVMESSMKPGSESAGGGFTWTMVNGKPVMRQAEGPEINASTADRTISPEYNAAEEQRKDNEDKIGDVNDEMPVNNATVFAELPTTVDSIRSGTDVYSANMSDEMRQELAGIVEGGNFEHADIKKFGDELRSNFGALTTPKAVKVDGKTRLTIVSETLAWDIQKGLLDKDGVGIVFTGSLADVRERGFNAEQARFIPLKQRPDAADPVINGARDKVSRRILFGNFFETFLPLVGGANQAMTTVKFTESPITNERGQLAYTFGTSGIRFSWDELMRQNPRIVQGIADYLNSKGVKKIVIGRDTRQGNIQNVQQGAAILAASGIQVVMLGTDDGGGFSLEGALSTPVIALLTKVYGAQGSLNYTASHNPKGDNGIKFSPEDGGAAPKIVTDEIQGFVNDENLTGYKTMDYQEAVKQGLVQEVTAKEAIGHYVDYFEKSLKSVNDEKGNTLWDNLINYIKTHPNDLFLFDSLQGTGGAVANALLNRIAQEAGQPDFYAVHHPTPSSEFEQVGGQPNVQLLANKPVDYDAKGRPMLATAVDGDADRLIWVGEKGKAFTSDEILAMSAYFLATEVDLPEYDAVVKTFVTSDFNKAVVDYLNQHGHPLTLYDSPTGFKSIADYTRAGHKVLIGGEDSFHIGFLSIFKETWDDAIAGALMGLVIKSMLEDVTDLQDKTLDGYFDYIKGKVLKPGENYIKIAVDTRRTEDRTDDTKTLNAVKALIAKTYQQIDSGVGSDQLEIIQKVKELLGTEFSSRGLTVPEIDQIKIEYQGPPGTNIPAQRDGIQIIFKNGDRIIERPSGTEPVGKGYVDAKNPQNVEPLAAMIRGLTSWARTEFDAGRLTGDPAMIQSNDYADDSDRASVTVLLATAGHTAVEPGGIDLNSRTLNMESSGQKVNITFDPAMIAQFKRGDFSGVRIQILDVVPINLMPLLGLKEDEEPGQLAKV